MLTNHESPGAGFTTPRTTCFTTGRPVVFSPPVVVLFAIEATLLLGLVALGVDIEIAAWTIGVLVAVTAAAAVGGPGALSTLRAIGYGAGAGALR